MNDLHIHLTVNTSPDNQTVKRPCPGHLVGAGPPIDDQVCVPKPPATGNWHISAVDGVIAIPYAWVQD